MDVSVANYLSQYTNFTKKVVYKFNLGDGGIGDYVKLFLVSLQFCIKHNIRIYNLIGDSLLIEYLKLKRDDMYITNEELIESVPFTNIDIIEDNTYYVITPQIIFDIIMPDLFCSKYERDCFDNFQLEILSFAHQFFYFTDEVKTNAKSFMHDNEDYISIHLRLGDRYLEIDKKLIQCVNDVRRYNEQELFKYIRENKDKKILFFCDNHGYKLKLKKLYRQIIITDYEIGHTTYASTSRKQVLNSVTDFFILSNSASIYAASYSGFSMMASKFRNVSVIYPTALPPTQTTKISRPKRFGLIKF